MGREGFIRWDDLSNRRDNQPREYAGSREYSLWGLYNLCQVYTVRNEQTKEAPSTSRSFYSHRDIAERDTCVSVYTS